MILRTRKQRYNFIAAVHMFILGLIAIGLSLVLFGWKWTLGIVLLGVVSCLVVAGATAWADGGE